MKIENHDYEAAKKEFESWLVTDVIPEQHLNAAISALDVMIKGKKLRAKIKDVMKGPPMTKTDEQQSIQDARLEEALKSGIFGTTFLNDEQAQHVFTVLEAARKYAALKEVAEGMREKKKDALENLEVLETDFCMGVENRAINNQGVQECLKSIRAFITGAQSDAETDQIAELYASRQRQQEERDTIGALKADVQAKDEALRRANARIRELVQEATENNERIQGLIAALQFYADAENYTNCYADDDGEVALAALKPFVGV